MILILDSAKSLRSSNMSDVINLAHLPIFLAIDRRIDSQTFYHMTIRDTNCNLLTTMRDQTISMPTMCQDIIHRVNLS